MKAPFDNYPHNHLTYILLVLCIVSTNIKSRWSTSYRRGYRQSPHEAFNPASTQVLKIGLPQDLSTDNLKYLSSEQALADLAYFIQGMNKKYGLDSTNKWIAFGGSYPGSLAAWLRLKYPHLVHGAVSTSGPLLALADFSGYNRVVQASLNTYGKNCSKAVYHANHQLQLLLRHPRGLKSIYKKFKLCSPLDVHNKKDVQSLFESLSNNIAEVVQYNKDNRGLDPYKITIDSICDILTDQKIGTPVDRYAAVNTLLLKEYMMPCLDYKYNSTINQLRYIDYERADNARQWTYQTCTEFGFYQTSEKKTSLFGPTFDVKFFEEMCTDVYGPEYNPSQLSNDIYSTNVNYGALEIDVTRVVFVHGSIDPWHALGITNSTKSYAPSIFINGTAHCANMYPPSPNDPPQLTKARVVINDLIQEWLNVNSSTRFS